MEALLAELATGAAGAAGAGAAGAAGAGAGGQPRGPRVLVLGGGVIGLTSAFLLQSHGYQVDVVSDTFPTDMHTGAAAGSGASSAASSSASCSASSGSGGPVAVPPHAKANFCSDKAGAHWFSFATADPIDAAQRQWDIVTYHALMALVHSAPDAAVTAVSSTQLFLDPTPNNGVQWWAPYVRDYQSVSPRRLKALSHRDVKWACGITFTAAMMHASRYLSWLSRAVQSLGVRLVKVDAPIRCLLTLLRAIDTGATGPHRYVAVVNCLALGAGSAFVPRPVPGSGVTERAQALYGAPSGGGVMGLSDPDVYPTRGQTVLVYAPHLTDGIWRCPGRAGTAEHSTYILPKGDGTVVLGGTYQHYDANLVPTREDAVDITRRCERLLPADLKGVTAAVEKSFDPTVRLSHASEGRIAQAVYCIDHRNTTAANARNAAAPRDLQVLRHSVGLRPSRRGGVRLEVQRVDSCRALVLHHYGHGGYGFQSSWGSAQAMLQLLSAALPAAASTACHCHRNHSAAFQASPRTAGAAAAATGRALERLRDGLPTPWLSAVHCVLSGCVAPTSGPALRALTAAAAPTAAAVTSATPQSKL